VTNQEIDRLVDIYLTHLTDSARDCGWRGDSMAARMIEFMGCPPAPTGNDKSNEGMINAIRGLREQHPDFPMIERLVKEGLSDQNHSHQVLALLSKLHYRGIHGEEGNEANPLRAYDDEDRGKKIGQDLAEFRFNVKAGYRFFRRRL